MGHAGSRATLAARRTDASDNLVGLLKRSRSLVDVSRGGAARQSNNRAKGQMMSIDPPKLGEGRDRRPAHVFTENFLDEIAHLELPQATGGSVLLADLWRDQHAVLVWLRHYACTFCRSYVTQISRHLDQLREAGAAVCGIGMGNRAMAAEFRTRWKLDFPVLVDGDRVTYQALELRRGRFVDVYGARVLVRGAANAVRGFPQGPARQDAYQLGGVVVVQRGGDIRYVHRSKVSGDDLPIQFVLNALA